MNQLPLPERDGEEIELLSSQQLDDSRLSSRTRARVRAVDVVFEADQRHARLEDVLADRKVAGPRRTVLPDFAAGLVARVAENRAAIDDSLATYSESWPLERMPAVDRAILRCGAGELLYGDDVPAPVLITEYGSVAELLSTADSPRFVKGLLGRLADVKGLMGGTPGPSGGVAG